MMVVWRILLGVALLLALPWAVSAQSVPQVGVNAPTIGWNYPESEESNIDGFRLYYQRIPEGDMQTLDVANPKARQLQMPTLPAGDWKLYMTTYKGDTESSPSNTIMVYTTLQAPKVYLYFSPNP